MNLKELLHDTKAKIYGKISSVEVRNLTRDSRNVGVGDIFIAKQGKHCDGNDFSHLAVENGAIAVASSIYNPFYPLYKLFLLIFLSLRRIWLRNTTVILRKSSVLWGLQAPMGKRQFPI